MYRIKVGGSFDSAHKLNGYDGKCKNLHGHTWTFQVVLGHFGGLDTIGMSVDFTRIKQWVKEVEDKYDHKNLNDIFITENPTAEIIAKHIYDLIKQRVIENPIAGLLVHSVIVWETPNNCIEYIGEE